MTLITCYSKVVERVIADDVLVWQTYDKAGGFHTGTPPPYGLAGSATGAPLGVGVSVGVGGPSPYAAQHMFIPTLAPHQSQHSHLNVVHQQLHQVLT